jgi:hypothetical protein
VLELGSPCFIIWLISYSEFRDVDLAFQTFSTFLIFKFVFNWSHHGWESLGADN